MFMSPIFVAIRAFFRALFNNNTSTQRRDVTRYLETAPHRREGLLGQAAPRTKFDRRQVALAEVTRGLEFLGSLRNVAEQVVSGQPVRVAPDCILDRNDSLTAACIICGGTSGRTPGTQRIENAEQFGKMLLFRRPDESTFVVSNTGPGGCFEQYFRAPINDNPRAVRGLDRLNREVGGFSEALRKLIA
jgi:hypothetical protein